MTTTGLPGAGCNGTAGSGRLKKETEQGEEDRHLALIFRSGNDRRRTLAGAEQGVRPRTAGPKVWCACVIQANGSSMLEGSGPNVNDGALQLELFAGGQRW